MNRNDNNNYAMQTIPNTFQQGLLANNGNSQPPLPHSPVRLSWWERQQQIKAQSKAISGGFIHIFSAGIHLATAMNYPRINERPVLNTNFHISISWFVGVIIGSLISSFLVKSLEKRMIYFSVGILSIISNLLLITLSTNNAAILVARYLAGFAHGILLIPLIIHATEVATNETRGYQLSGISMGLSIGMLTYVLLYSVTVTNLRVTSDFMHPIRLPGIISLIYAVLGVIMTYFFTYESPVYLISKGRDQLALTNMIKIRNESAETWEIRKDFLELKELVNEDRNQSSNIFSDRNILPLVRITLLRCLYVLSTSVIIFQFLNFLTMLQFLKFDIVLANYMPTILFAIRGLTEMFVLFAIDKIGRRMLMLFSAGASGLILIIAGTLFILNSYDNPVLPALSITYFILIGYGLGAASFTYLGEAFPLNKKPVSMFFVIIIENLLSIILTCVYMYSPNEILFYKTIFLVTGGNAIVIGLCLFVMLPETKQLNLKECRNKMI